MSKWLMWVRFSPTQLKIKNMNNKLRNIVISYRNSNMNPKLLTNKLTKYYNLTNGESHELLWILLNKDIK